MAQSVERLPRASVPCRATPRPGELLGDLGARRLGHPGAVEIERLGLDETENAGDRIGVNRKRPALLSGRQRERVDPGKTRGHRREVVRQARGPAIRQRYHQAAPGKTGTRLDPAPEGRRAAAGRGVGEARLLVIEVVGGAELELARARKTQDPRRAGDAHVVVEQTLDGHRFELVPPGSGEAVHQPQPGTGRVQIES